MQNVGFKEWAIVCQALELGRQSIILRKGGIAEGSEGFSFQHREFFLFPTYFHEQVEKVREENLVTPEKPADAINISCLAKVDLVRLVDSWPIAQALEPLHILRSEVVRERFEYDEAPGLHVAFVRAFRVVPTWTFPDEKRFGGCRSWVDLPKPPDDLRFEPVLSEGEHERAKAQFLNIVGDVAQARGESA